MCFDGPEVRRKTLKYDILLVGMSCRSFQKPEAFTLVPRNVVTPIMNTEVTDKLKEPLNEETTQPPLLKRFDNK